MRAIELKSAKKEADYVTGRVADLFKGIGAIPPIAISIPSRGNEDEVWAAAAFEHISVMLEKELVAEAEGDASQRPPRVMCVVPLLDEEDSLEMMKVTSATGGFSTVVGMLIISFPEIHWVLPHIWDKNNKIEDWIKSWAYSGVSCWKLLKSAHLEVASAVQLAAMGFSPLFDPAGLRQIILHNSVEECCSRENPLPPYGHSRYQLSREQLVGVLEDEPSYLYFLAYAAYKGGRRCNLLYNYRLMEQSLHRRRLDIRHQILIEDINLEFSDKPRSVSLALGARAKEFSGFDEANTRVLVTNGVEREGWSAERDIIAADLGFSISLTNLIKQKTRSLYIDKKRRIYSSLFAAASLARSVVRLPKVWRHVLDSRQDFELRYHIILKPVSSIHSLMSKAGLDGWTRLEANRSMFDIDTSSESHRVLGQIRAIAEVLSERSKRLLVASGDATMATYGAVLALQAQELLASRIPSMSFDLIATRHVSELKAESLFYGTDAILNIDRRIRDVRTEVGVTAQRVSKANRRQAKLNAEARIVNDLIILLRERNYFDAELRCLRRLFGLECQLRWWRRKGISRLWGLLPDLAGFIVGRFVTSVPLSFSLAVFVVSAAALGFSGFASSSAEAWSWAFDAFSGGDLPSNLANCRGSVPAWLWIGSRYAGVGFLGILIALILFRLTRR